MEATAEQRQRLIEAIFRRSYIRRKNGMPPLCIDRAYAQGLNRILSKNIKAAKATTTNVVNVAMRSPNPKSALKTADIIDFNYYTMKE